MKRTGRWHRTAVVWALLGVMIPQPLLASQPQPGSRDAVHAAHDVALDNRGTLHGQVVDESGTPATGAVVHVAQNGHELQSVATDEQGRFEVTGLRGGVYQITTDQSGANYRLWAPNTAPPAAQEVAFIVENGDVVRGQGPIISFLTNPWVLAAGVAAAIAIPLALDDDDDAS